MNYIRLLIPFMFLFLLSVGVTAQDQLSPQEFEEKINGDDNIQLVDVRTPEEFSKGFIHGARNYNINDKDFASRVGRMDKARPVYVYCLSGPRSSKASAYMRKQGFTVYELKGGMMAWNREKKPVAKGKSKPDGMSMTAFQQEVQNEKIVLVDFYAKWCGPCKKMAPDLEALKEKYGDKLVLLKIDADANGNLLDDLKVEALPTLHLYKAGERVWNHTGYLERKDIEKQILKTL